MDGCILYWAIEVIVVADATALIWLILELSFFAFLPPLSRLLSIICAVVRSLEFTALHDWSIVVLNYGRVSYHLGIPGTFREISQFCKIQAKN